MRRSQFRVAINSHRRCASALEFRAEHLSFRTGPRFCVCSTGSKPISDSRFNREQISYRQLQSFTERSRQWNDPSFDRYNSIGRCHHAGRFCRHRAGPVQWVVDARLPRLTQPCAVRTRRTKDPIPIYLAQCHSAVSTCDENHWSRGATS